MTGGFEISATSNRFVDHPAFNGTRLGESLRRAPLGFIDIGARGGVHDIVAPVSRLTDVLCFEPDKVACDELQQAFGEGSAWAKFTALPVALADRSGTATLHRMAAPTNDSLLPANTAMTERYKIVTMADRGAISIETSTLDEVLSTQGSHAAEFIKIDVQGAERAVLQGGEKTLREKAVAIFSETYFLDAYEGQPLFSDIEIYLRSLGFSFYGFQSLHRRSLKQLDKKTQKGRERLMWADAVFFKDTLTPRAGQEPLDVRGRQALFVCATLLGSYDFALELASRSFDPEEAGRLGQIINSFAEAPPATAAAEVQALQERVQQAPDLANIEVGRFVDRRRHLFDYDDVSLS